MRLDIEQRTEHAKMIYKALEKAKSEKLVNVTVTNIKDEVCIELTCNKVLRDAKNRAQIWICATRIDIWHGATFDRDFDGDNVLFTSNDWQDRTIKNVVDKDGNPKEKLTRFNDFSEFFPLMIDAMCNIAQGKHVNIDKTIKALSEAVKATENKTDSDSAKETATAKKDSTKATDSKAKRQTKAKTDSTKETAKKTDSKAKETAKQSAK